MGARTFCGLPRLCHQAQASSRWVRAAILAAGCTACCCFFNSGSNSRQRSARDRCEYSENVCTLMQCVLQPYWHMQMASTKMSALVPPSASPQCKEDTNPRPKHLSEVPGGIHAPDPCVGVGWRSGRPHNSWSAAPHCSGSEAANATEQLYSSSRARSAPGGSVSKACASTQARSKGAPKLSTKPGAA